MRTLCVACHANVTAAQCAERRLEKAKAKKQLKVTLNDLRAAEKMEKPDSAVKDKDHLENRNIIDEGLLFEVPGSAYSRARNDDSGNE
ncbi:hypothetical protein NMG60_11004203, partial [Bertholletia excelsa]